MSTFPPYMSQTENILNRETQGKVRLPAFVSVPAFAFLLFKVLLTNHAFSNIIFLPGLKNGVCKSIRLFEFF